MAQYVAATDSHGPHNGLPRSADGRPTPWSAASTSAYLPGRTIKVADLELFANTHRSAQHRLSPVYPVSARQIERACKSAAIFMVAKLEKVSEIAYGRTMRSPWRIAPQV